VVLEVFVLTDTNLPTGTAGIIHYFVQVTNTISNNGDGGTKVATIRSNPIEIRIISPSGIIINLPEINEWDLIEQTIQVFANENNIFTVNGTFVSYSWYLDGVLVGTSSAYTFNKPANVYQLVVVVKNSSGDSRSGRSRITAK
jgi:hypothetical protein